MRITRRQRRIDKMIVGGAMTVALMLTPALSANAATSASVGSQAHADPTIGEVQGIAAQAQADPDSWVNLDSNAVDALVDDYTAMALTPQSGLNFSLASAEGFDIGNGISLLKLPASDGQGVEEQTSISAFFDASGNLVGLTEFAFRANSENSGSVKVWSDDQLLVDQVVTAPTSQTPEITTRSNASGSQLQTYHKGDWWGNFSQCLSNAGVAAWVITGLSIACSAVCVVTVGIGCPVCLGAASAGFGGTVGFCIQQAGTNS
jgi:hypothetical protein